MILLCWSYDEWCDGRSSLTFTLLNQSMSEPVMNFYYKETGKVGGGWNTEPTLCAHLQSYIIVGTSYYCRIDGWLMWSNIQHREWNWAWKWILVSQFAAETDIDMRAIVIQIIDDYSMILTDDALLLLELWLLNDMCVFRFSSPMSSLELGISVVAVANVHRLITLMARLRRWW